MAALVLPGSYLHYLDMISSLSIGPVLIGLAKFGLAFPASYHTYNGIRHLVSSLALMMIHLPLQSDAVVLMLTCLLFPVSSASSSPQFWDLGKGFQIPDVYRSGYTVIALSIVTAMALMFL